MFIIRTVSSIATFCLAATALAACTAGSANDGAVAGDPQALTECDGNGTWAIKIETPVTWSSSLVVQGGSGTVTNWLRSTREQTGTSIVDTASICGVTTPDYLSSAIFGGEKYGVAFPEELFESGTLPTVTINGSLSSTEEGATYSSDAAAAIVGASMPNAATDAWPANGAQLSPVDSDNDSKVGVSVNTNTSAGYKNPPLNPARTARANQVYTAFRQVITSQGVVTSCNRVEGTGTIAVIAGKAAIDQHVLGCRREDGAECSASEYKLLDTAAPVYKPSGEAVVTMVRVPANATCAEVRAIDYATATGAADAKIPATTK